MEYWKKLQRYAIFILLHEVPEIRNSMLRSGISKSAIEEYQTCGQFEALSLELRIADVLSALVICENLFDAYHNEIHVELHKRHQDKILPDKQKYLKVWHNLLAIIVADPNVLMHGIFDFECLRDMVIKYFSEEYIPGRLCSTDVPLTILMSPLDSFSNFNRDEVADFENLIYVGDCFLPSSGKFFCGIAPSMLERFLYSRFKLSLKMTFSRALLIEYEYERNKLH